MIGICPHFYLLRAMEWPNATHRTKCFSLRIYFWSTLHTPLTIQQTEKPRRFYDVLTRHVAQYPIIPIPISSHKCVHSRHTRLCMFLFSIYWDCKGSDTNCFLKKKPLQTPPFLHALLLRASRIAGDQPKTWQTSNPSLPTAAIVTLSHRSYQREQFST